jgi:pantetheine-phosphate adenylyltransferase
LWLALDKTPPKRACFHLNNEKHGSKTPLTVVPYQGLTINFCDEINSQFILRGLRNANDFQYESQIAQMNQALNNNVLSVFVVCDAKYAAINSTIVREIHKNKGDVSQFLPSAIDLNKAT